MCYSRIDQAKVFPWKCSQASRWIPTFASGSRVSPAPGIDVATVVGALAAGETVDTVAEEYQLSVAQVLAALSYAAHVAARRPPGVVTILLDENFPLGLLRRLRADG